MIWAMHESNLIDVFPNNDGDVKESHYNVQMQNAKFNRLMLDANQVEQKLFIDPPRKSCQEYTLMQKSRKNILLCNKVKSVKRYFKIICNKI